MLSSIAPSRQRLEFVQADSLFLPQRDFDLDRSSRVEGAKASLAVLTNCFLAGTA